MKAANEALPGPSKPWRLLAAIALLATALGAREALAYRHAHPPPAQASEPGSLANPSLESSPRVEGAAPAAPEAQPMFDPLTRTYLGG